MGVGGKSSCRRLRELGEHKELGESFPPMQPETFLFFSSLDGVSVCIL